MRSFVLPLAACAVVISLAVGSARAASNPNQLFPKEADLFANRAGLVRLVLPVEVMAACKPDLSNLRLFDRSGREVPYLVDASPIARPEPELLQRVAGQIIDADRKLSKDSEGGPHVYEEFRLATPPVTVVGVEAGKQPAWTLAIDSAASRFIRTLDVWVETSGREKSMSLATSVTLFRLEGGERTSVELPPLPFEGALHLEIRGGEEFYLEPTFRLEAKSASTPRAEAVLPLAIAAQHAAPGRTILEVKRPLGVVPDALRFETRTPNFMRRVRVLDLQAGRADTLLGQEDIFRYLINAPARVLDVPLGAASGARLRVEIEDRDSPPLENLKISAVARQPALVFAIEPAPDGAPAGVVRFGGKRARRPDYDLARLVGAHGGDVGIKDALAALRNAEPSGSDGARLGDPRDAPAFELSSALAFAMQPGAKLDAAPWLRRRMLTVPTNSQGLSQLRLSAEDIAAARPDLADLRVVSDAGDQRPYFLQTNAASERIEATAQAALRSGSESRYVLELPVAPLPVDQLEFDFETRFFDRRYQLFATGEGGDATLVAAGRLSREADRIEPVAIQLRGERARAFELRVDDGDDAPLALGTVHARIPVAELFLLAPPGSYQLLLGNPAAEAPRYDVASVRNLALSEASVRIEAAALEPNPDYRVTARLLAGDRPRHVAERALVWASLLGAVAILAGITLRTVRHETNTDRET